MATAKKTPAATKAVAKTAVKLPPKPVAKKAAVKPAAKAAVKLAAPRAPGAAAPATKAVPAKPAAAKPVAPKAEKPRKPKLVRDSFTIPKAEYVVLDALKARAAKLESPAKKSELLRAGIKALAGMADKAFVEALAQVPAIKTGRPGKD